MADYTAFTWVNDDGSGTTGTAVSATRMNAIEAGVHDAAEHNKMGTLASRPAAASGNKGWVYYATDTAALAISTGSVWTAVSPATTNPAIVSALPGSPVDGDVCYYQDAAMATAGTVWQLRYRSGGGTSKWEFIGGAPLYSSVATSGSTSSSSFVAIGAGPAIALPLAGDYLISIGAGITTPTAGQSSWMSYDIGGTTAIEADGIETFITNANQTLAAQQRTQLKTGLTAVTLTAKYKSTGGTAFFTTRWMTAAPVRVG